MRFAAGLVALAAVIAGLYYYFLVREVSVPAPVVQAPASQPSEPAIIVRAVVGEATRKNAQGQEERLRVGTALVASDEVRTELGGSAIIAAADNGELRLDEGTAIGIGAGDFFLLQGSLEANSGTAPLRLGAAGSKGRITVDGRARLLADGQSVVVGDISGKTEVENGGQRVTLAPGQATRVKDGLPPSAVWTIPSSLLLKVRWPSETDLATKKIRVSGQVTPGSLVRVRGTKTLADEAGKFAAEVNLDEGINIVDLEALDAGGHRQKSQVKLRVDTTPADVGIETNPEMWKKKH